MNVFEYVVLLFLRAVLLEQLHNALQPLHNVRVVSQPCNCHPHRPEAVCVHIRAVLEEEPHGVSFAHF